MRERYVKICNLSIAKELADFVKNELLLDTNVDVDENTSVQQNLQEIANNVDFNSLNIVVTIGVDDSISISLSGGGIAYDGLPITNLLVGDGNPLNISQFVPLDQQKSNVDIDKANEFLDTNIFELLPSGDTRQSRIIRFFQELNTLLPPNLPQFDLDNNGRVDRGVDMNCTC